MSEAPAIRVEAATKLFRRQAPGRHFRTLKSALLEGSLVGRATEEETITALRDVSFEVARGEAFGIVGSNGSGKSTLLKLLAGILRPTRGRVLVDGRVAALIELGAGFHPEISGRENVFINGALLGLSRREIERRYEQIVDFSGLADFMEEPVKNYSSGMYVRLGFAVAIHTDPEILLVDEVLAVGDESFAHRCLRRIEELLAAGRTVLFVSHSLALVEGLCDRVAWLEGGTLRAVGEPRRVVDAYRQAVAEAESAEHQRSKEEREAAEAAPAEAAAPAEVLRWGSGAAEITAVRLLDEVGAERYHFASGEAVTIDPRSYARYDGLADTLESMDPANLARLYSLLKPRMRDAYRELGHPEGDIDAAVERALVHLLETPAPDGEITLDRQGVPYTYRDPALERLSPAQKQLLRMGPRNVRIVKDRLREIAGQLGIPAERLPAAQQD